MVEASAAPSKVCASCGGRYPTDALFCPTDGMPLQSQAAAERDVDDPYLGQEISGHIEIRQLVGVGAMGRVYRAFQRGIDRDVAVKILHRELSANAQLVSRFTREAKVASRLQHPNVVHVLLSGQLPDRALYMVMEYLDGLSLQSALAGASGALPLPRALHIALQLCEAVGEAHAQGIVHRDLKPENVMLVRRGADHDFVKVLDFGIARINWGEQSVATAAGLIFGTARYISPEGAQGNTVGPASDVYSIGTLLFQMLSGRTPFDGDQAVGLLVQQIHDPPPDLRSIPRAAYVPQPIADVVMATLAKDPEKREPDARALAHAIFDAAKLAGLSPDEFSRPLRGTRQSAMKLPPVERTKQHDLTPDILERMTPDVPSAASGPPTPGVNGSAAPADISKRQPTAATVKWEPPSEFQARLAQGEVRARTASSVDSTIDDLSLDASHAPLPVAAFPSTPSRPVALPSPSTPAIPRTLPGDADGDAPVRTHYTPPSPEAVGPSPRRLDSDHDVTRASLASESDGVADAPLSQRPRRSRGFFLVALCFLLGVGIAGGWAYNAGKIGHASAADAADEERVVARATAAMFKNRFYEPPGDNVKEITDDGLRRWPHHRRLLDIRARAASELTTQAVAQRSGGDLLEALKLARLAHELDADDATAKRLVEQYEAELAAFSPSAAPTLLTPAPSPMPAPKPMSPPPKPNIVPPGPGPAPHPAEYKALLDVSQPTPRLGQTVEFMARVAPPKGAFDQPGFNIVGPGVPGGVRVPALSPAPGVFKASYAFLEPGRFDITFTTQADGKPIAAKRTVNAANPPPAPNPSPPPGPAPAPTPTASVKWM